MSTERHAWAFRAAIVASFALLVYMFLPFLTVLLTALVLTVVSWPLYARLSQKIGRIPGALLTTALITLVVLGPTGLAVWLGLQEAWDAAEELISWVEQGGLDRLQQTIEGWLSVAPPLLDLLRNGASTDWIETTVLQALQDALQSAARQATGAIGLLLQALTQVMVGLASWVALYLEGPRLLLAVRRAGLLPDEYIDRLLIRFSHFAHSVILGMMVTATSQGAVASFGFFVVGAERVALLGILTAFLSQFPIVGSAVVWLPVAASLAASGRYVAALFIVIWSIALTASVDNLLKPLIYHEGLDVHPLLVLLSLLAGMTTFGPAGVLVGPLLLVLFLTLWTLYDRDVLTPR